MKKTVYNSKTIATMAVLSALSFILYVFLKFPLPIFFPSFLDIQFSDLPIILGSYLFGAGGGIFLAIIRMLLKMPLTSTAMVGETADLMITIAFIIPSSIIFHKSKSDKKLIISLVFGSISAVIVAVAANQLLLIPFYVEFIFGGELSVLSNMLTPLYPNITTENFYVYYQLFAVIPFNILRLSICSILVGITHKKLEKIYQ